MKDLNYPKKSKDVPVTKAMLDEAVDGLRTVVDGHYSEFKNFRIQMGREFTKFRSEMASEFTAVRTEMSQGFTEVKSEIHRLALLVEEQNARNIFVLDGLTQLSDRQERLEKDYSKRFGS